MTRFWTTGLLFVVLTGSVWAEDKPRRRRFITYDQPGARVVPEVSEALSDEVNETEGQRALREETSDSVFSLDRDPLESSLPAMSPSPSMLRPEEASEMEEEEERWITMEDLMTTEDLIGMELEAQPTEEPEEMEEIVEWDELQEAMIGDELKGSPEDEPTLDEMMEQRQEDAEAAWMERASEGSDAEAGGLQMGAVLEAGDVEPAGERVRAEEGAGDVALDPVLRPVSLAGEQGQAVIGDPSVQPRADFSGSRALLSDLQARWDPRQRTSEPGQRPQPSAIPVDQLRNPFAQQASPSGFGSVGAGPRVEPLAPVQSAPPPVSVAPPRQEPIRREPSTRIRSRLGADGF